MGNKILVGNAGNDIALVEELCSFWDIGRGLIGSGEPGLKNGLYEGLLLRIPGYRKKCRGLINSIHMIGMGYPIAVFWISGFTVVDRAYALPGFHVYSSRYPSSAVLELPKEAFGGLEPGDVLDLRPFTVPEIKQS